METQKMVRIDPSVFYLNLFYAVKPLKIHSLTISEISHFAYIIKKYLGSGSKYALDCTLQMDLYGEQTKDFFRRDRRFIRLEDYVVFGGKGITSAELKLCNSVHYLKTRKGLELARKDFTDWIHARYDANSVTKAQSIY